jgi:hypothetical protein
MGKCAAQQTRMCGKTGHCLRIKLTQQGIEIAADPLQLVNVDLRWRRIDFARQVLAQLPE